MRARISAGAAEYAKGEKRRANTNYGEYIICQLVELFRGRGYFALYRGDDDFVRETRIYRVSFRRCVNARVVRGCNSCGEVDYHDHRRVVRLPKLVRQFVLESVYQA